MIKELDFDVVIKKAEDEIKAAAALANRQLIDAGGEQFVDMDIDPPKNIKEEPDVVEQHPFDLSFTEDYMSDLGNGNRDSVAKMRESA